MKPKPRRIVVVDKVAMVALPLLLLLFFFIYARPKSWFNSTVDLPEGTFQIHNEGDAELTVILKKGRYALAIDPGLRVSALQDVSNKYHVEFNDEQLNKFSRIEVFKPDIKELRAYIDSTKVTEGRYDGPMDTLKTSASDELLNWMTAVREQVRAKSDRPVRLALLCDKDEPYPNVQTVRKTAQKAGILHIKLIHTGKRPPY